MTSKWPLACENSFNDMAENAPHSLIEWVNSGELRSSDLTFALEILGKVPASLPTLISFMGHESPMVREGALYGLAILHSHIDCIVGYHAEADASPGVRSVAKEMWEEWGGE